MGDINNTDDGDVTINPDKAGADGESREFAERMTPQQGAFGRVDRPDPDFEVTLEMADRVVTLKLAEDESMALQNEMGQPFAELSINSIGDE